MNDTKWIEKAICRGKDLELFFSKYDHAKVNEKLEILEICNSCGVKSECLSYAKSTRQWGVWGGEYFENGRPMPNPVGRRPQTESRRDELAKSKNLQNRLASLAEAG